jgi:hypothetical protein
MGTFRLAGSTLQMAGVHALPERVRCSNAVLVPRPALSPCRHALHARRDTL